jgi:heat shock protein HslJ
MRIGRLVTTLTLASAASCAVAATQLTGQWQVEDIGGAGVIDSSNVTLDFTEPGRIAGSGGCNRYTATLVAEGEALAVGPAAATRRMCPEALMIQEQRFFDALATVTRYGRDNTGALLFYAGDTPEPVIVARESGD